MKKIYSFILTAVVCLAGLAACTKDYPVAPMATSISLSPDAKVVPAEGQSFDVTVNADGAWVAEAPDWITVTPACGDRGQDVRVTVAPNTGTERTDKIKFHSAVGDVSTTDITLARTPLAELTVTQAAGEGQGGGSDDDIPTISIADYLALGANTDPYIITGTITRIVKKDYGNFDLTDETGTIYVYGLLTEDLEEKKCFTEKGLALGDVLTVKAPSLTLYNNVTWEIVNAVYVSHSKSLIKLESDNITVPKEGQDFDVKAEVKGADVKVDFDADWITFKGASKEGDDVTLSFTAAENPGVPRSALMTISTTNDKGESSTAEFTVKQEGSILTVTLAEVLAAADNENLLYRVTGYVSKVNDLTKGRIYVTDYTGTVYAYGTRVSKESDSVDLTTLGLELGDIVTIIGYKTTFNTTVEIVGYVESFSKVESVTVEQFLAKDVAADKWYRLQGSVTEPNETETASGNKFDLEQYGNFVLEDETGRTYVYGVLTGLGQTDKKIFSTLGVSENDVITIVGQRAAFNGAPQVGKAWYVSHYTPEPPENPDDPGQPENPDPPVDEGQTITEILTLANDSEVNSATSLVMALTSRGFIATDGTKAVYVYTQGSDFNGVAKIGDKVKFSGSKTVYGGVHEVQYVSALEVVSSGNEVVYPEATDITSQAETFSSEEAVFVSLTGKLSKSGNYYNIILDNTTAKQGSIVYPVAELGADGYDGKKIKITGYFNGLTGSGKYINVITTSIEEVGSN